LLALGVKTSFFASVRFHDSKGFVGYCQGFVHAHQFKAIFSINSKIDKMVR
jgi:hypothetical protein